MTNNTDLLNSVLDSDVGSNSSTAFAVRKDNYSQLVALQNVSSYSIQQLMYSCPRKYQLAKMSADCIEPEPREFNVDFAFGHAVGAGVAEYDKTRDLHKAYWAAFIAWNMDLLAEKETQHGRNQKKSFAHAMWALNLYQSFFLEEGLDEYEVKYIEATIGVDLEDGNYYSGHIDEILKHKEHGRYKIKENKTTSFDSVDPALYANSDQALSYAAVVGALEATEYDVFYCIYSSTEQRWIAMQFVKSPLAKAEWLQTQLLFGSEKEEYARLNFFPRRGGSCFEYNRRCKYYESCDFNSERVFGKRFDQLRRIESLDELAEIEPLDFRLTVSDIIASQETDLQSTGPATERLSSALATKSDMETL